MADNSGNGKPEPGQVQQVEVDTLVLTYNRLADQLEIGGRCHSLDLMLDMLARATRELEGKWRLQQLRIAQQQAADQVIADQIRRSVAGKG